VHTVPGASVSTDRSSFADLRVLPMLGAELGQLWRRSPQTFASLFMHKCGAAAEEIAGLPTLTASGLVRCVEGQFRSLFRIFHHNGIFVLSDWKGNASDEVFRPWQAEVDVTAPFFLDGNVGASVLDLGCGSGLYGIAAAAVGATKVQAVDLNPRALAAARFNARLNGAADRISVRRSNLFDDVVGRFDVILAGLPYRPTPPMPAGKVYANGGARGIEQIERTFRRAGGYLSIGGEIRVCSMSLGDGRHTLVERRAAEILGGDRTWDLHIQQVGKAVLFRDWWADNGDPDRAATNWLAALEDEGLTHFQRVRLSAKYAKAR